MNGIVRALAMSLALGFALVPAASARQADPQPVKYWIFLADKRDAAGKATVPEADRVTERARARRLLRGTVPDPLLDAPLSPAYLDALRQRGIAPLAESRWLNAVSAFLSDRQAEAVRRLPFVRAVQPVGSAARAPAPEAAPPVGAPQPAGKATLLDYGASRTQLELINAVAPLERGINGTGVRLGFLDTEFGGFDHPAFERLVAEGRLLADSNFVGQPQDSRHGRQVASVAVGFDEGDLIGPGYGAEVVAATTEQNDLNGRLVETNQEEDNFVRGLEWLEAMGVDVVNVSLGYNEFDPGQRSYTPADLDGDTGVTTRAADLAAALGVVVVASAGNEGSSSWRLVLTPADGDSVIAVGAVNADSALASFSSRGPTADGRTKPDVAALGVGVHLASASRSYGSGSGTSFAAPLVSGVVCQMLQVNPRLNPIDVRDILRETASQAGAPDNNLGWGIINADAAIEAAAQHPSPVEDAILPPGRLLVAAPYPHPFSEQTVFEVRAPAGAGFARLRVYDLLGRRVGVPFEGRLQAGLNRIDFRADGLPPGLYVYTLTTDDASHTGKMLLVK